jgi:uncharacterized protein (TIGR00255 family)
MKSMTGFGRSSNRTSGSANDLAVELDIAIRTVNGRYLEARFHLPREYAALESDFKSLLSTTFSRGTVDIYINRKRSAAGDDSTDIRVNAGLAKKWLKAFHQLDKDLKLDSDVSLEMITRLPDVMQVEESSELSEAEAVMAKDLLAAAAKACDSERLREGKALQTELESLCARLEAHAGEMEEMKLEAKAELERRYRDRLREGLSKMGFEVRIDEQRIAQEIVIQLDRADISEELHRLKEHLKAYRGLLKSDEPQGKKLDFYAQELLREVNTVGSKSHIARLTSLVVDSKTLVEKIREQVQNIE